MAGRVAPLAVLACLALTACGGETAGVGAGSHEADAAILTADASASSRDASSAANARGPDATAQDAASDAPVLGTGYIVVSNEIMNGMVIGIVVAGFPSPGTGCSATLSVPPCALYVCPLPSATAGELSSAGTITVTGTDSPVSIPPTNDGSYVLEELLSADAGRIFEPGATLVASASGAVVPAFSNEHVVGPSDVVLTQPTMTVVTGPSTTDAASATVTGYSIDTSVDLQLAWTGGEPGTLARFEFASGIQTEVTFVSCDFDATTRQGTVPKQLIARFAGVSSVVFTTSAYRLTSFQAGPFTTTLEAFTDFPAPATLF